MTTRYQTGRVVRYATAVVKARKPGQLPHAAARLGDEHLEPAGQRHLVPFTQDRNAVAFITVEATRLASNWSGEAILE